MGIIWESHYFAERYLDGSALNSSMHSWEQNPYALPSTWQVSEMPAVTGISQMKSFLFTTISGVKAAVDALLVGAVCD